RFRAQFLKHHLDQAFVLVHHLGLRFVAHHGEFHRLLHWLRFRSTPAEDVARARKDSEPRKNSPQPNPLACAIRLHCMSIREEIAMTEMSEKKRKFWVLALASIGSCMVALDALVVTTALSSIRVSLGASLESLEWTVNAYNLSFAVL